METWVENVRNKFSVKLFYTVALLPVTVFTYNVNFSFAFLYLHKSYKKVNDVMLQIFVFYIPVCYVLALFQAGSFGIEAVFRQLISVSIFVSLICLLYVKFDEEDIKRLVNAVIYAALLYSTWIWLMILTQHNLTLANVGALKVELRQYIWAWPQYYLPILLFAAIVCISRAISKIQYGIFAIVIVSVLIFTSLRSAYLSFASGVIFYIFLVLFTKNTTHDFKKDYLN